MKSFEFSAKTVERAIAEGLQALGKAQEDVDIQILSEGGFFKKAKVVISFDDETKLTNFAKKVDETPAPKAEATQNGAKTQPQTTASKSQEAKAELGKQQQSVASQVQGKEQNDKTSKATEVKQKKASQNKNAPKTQQQIEEHQRQYEKNHFQNNTTSVQFVSGLLGAMHITAQVEIEEKRDCSSVQIDCEDAKKIIGSRGETLSAIQYLANIVEAKTNPKAKRVVVDVAGYKQQRQQSLCALAIKIAGKVESSGKPYRMRPMNAFERRIVHTELCNYPSVQTFSEGVEPHRYIVVAPKEKQNEAE